jgi:hypothetical protein
MHDDDTPHRAELETIFAAYRAGILDWPGIQRSQEYHSYRPCDNGCLLPGQWRTLDDRRLCGPCYADIALDEQRQIFGSRCDVSSR